MVYAGQRIAGRYDVIKEIGSGGTSTVYLVADSHLNKNFAIKEIRKNDVVNARDIAGSLIEEANIMNKLNHPLLPRIIDVLDREEYVYVVMDYITGQPLNKVMKHYKKIPEQYVIHWFKQLCEVLTYLHMANPPIIFRDLKPSNIILTEDGSIRLIDFGAAREYKRAPDATGNNWGTRGYAAPEQVMMNGVVDARSDIYSLGVTMHYLLTGRDPRIAEDRLLPIRQVDPALSGELERIIIKCTQFKPEDRYQNCKELYYDLCRVQNGGSVNEKKKSNHTLTIVTVVISAVVFLFTVLIFMFSALSPGGLGISSLMHFFVSLPRGILCHMIC